MDKDWWLCYALETLYSDGLYAPVPSEQIVTANQHEHTNIKTPTEGIIFWKNGYLPINAVPNTCIIGIKEH